MLIGGVDSDTRCGHRESVAKHRFGSVWHPVMKLPFSDIPKQVQFLPNQIGSGRVFLSCLLLTAAGESPSEPAALEKMPTAGPRKAIKARSGSEFYITKGFQMLVLARNFGQEVIVTIGEHKMVIKVIEMTGKQVKLGFTSSREVRIDRKEIHDAIQETGFNPEAFPIAPLVPGVVRLGERLPGQLMRTK